MECHVHRIARLGACVLIRRSWYKYSLKNSAYLDFAEQSTYLLATVHNSAAVAKVISI